MKLFGSDAGVALIVALSLAPNLSAQQAPPPPDIEVGAAQLALLAVPVAGSAKLTVSSPAFKAGGDIPFENTQYRGNVFPGLSWTGAPAGTQSFVVIMQDTDAMMRGAPILHWTMLNIPGTVTTLAPGMKEPPAGAVNGPNMRGANQPYTGPRTPAGPKHRYHLQVFALNNTLEPDAAATFVTLTDAMKGHVVASGELVGLGQQMPAATPKN